MSLSHSAKNHHHEHSPSMVSLNKAFIIGTALNLGFVVVEFLAGIYYDSLGLLSDAGHNLSDVASLILAMFAFRLAKTHANKHYTYGYKKSTILVSLINAVILLIAVGVIIVESIHKFKNPQPIEGGIIAWVAGAGVFINAFTAWLFMKDKEKDLNVKGAYLHMVADALVSVGVVISGVIISFTGWYIIDPIIGLIIAIVIVISTWNLLQSSLRLSLDGVPKGINIKEIQELICAEKNVIDCHHLHIWAISTTETALTAHVVVDNIAEMQCVKESLKRHLGEKNITHATLEFETKNDHCCSSCT